MSEEVLGRIGDRVTAFELREALRDSDRLDRAEALLDNAFGPKGATGDAGFADEVAHSPDGERAAGRRDNAGLDLIDGA